MTVAVKEAESAAAPSSEQRAAQADGVTPAGSHSRHHQHEHGRARRKGQKTQRTVTTASVVIAVVAIIVALTVRQAAQVGCYSNPLAAACVTLSLTQASISICSHVLVHRTCITIRQQTSL